MLKANRTSLELMVAAYLDCAAWSSQDLSYEDEHMADAECLPWSAEAKAESNADCLAFLAKFDVDAITNYEQAGRDFWLTRNGHGAGFWDGDWPEPFATEASDVARSFRERHPYSENGELFFT